MDKDQEGTNVDTGQRSEDEESEEIEEVLEGVITPDGESGGSSEPLMVLQQQNSSNQGQEYSTEVSESSSTPEKQDAEKQLTDQGDESQHDIQHDTLQSTVDPVLSDEDDSNRLESENVLTKSNLKKVVSDTDISEIVMQDPASDREILEGDDDNKDDISEDNMNSVSDDNELNVSLDNYMEFPTAQKKPTEIEQVMNGLYNKEPRCSSAKPDRSFDTDDVLNARYERESVVSDIFEPTQPKMAFSDQPGYSRYDDLRSKYTRPRLPPHRPEDPKLTYLPARGVRSYAPFLQSSPLAGTFMDTEQVRLFLFEHYNTEEKLTLKKTNKQCYLSLIKKQKIRLFMTTLTIKNEQFINVKHS